MIGMLRFSFVFAVLSLLGCWHPASPRLTEDTPLSVYKIHADVEYDRSSLGEDAPGHDEWTGTAWVVDRKGGRSYLMTAGHVCETGKTYAYSDPWGLKDDVQLPIISVKYDIEGLDGTGVGRLQPILDDDDVDLCMLSAFSDLGDPIPLADRDPPYAGVAQAIGAPTGIWGGGVAPVVDLVYSGRGQAFGDPPDALAFTGLGDHGSSGSPIIYEGRAVAVLTEGSTRYVRLVTGVPWDAIENFERRAFHRPLR